MQCISVIMVVTDVISLKMQGIAVSTRVNDMLQPNYKFRSELKGCAGSSIFYRVYQGFTLNLGKRSKLIIFVSIFTTFNRKQQFWGGAVITKNWLKQWRTQKFLEGGAWHKKTGVKKNSNKYDNNIVFYNNYDQLFF